MGGNKEKHTAVDLKDVSTRDLCRELEKREAVNHIWVEPHCVKEVNVKVEGPCIVYIVYD